VPIDVLWFRVPRAKSDPGQILGRFARGKIMVMLDRNDYWQCAYLIAKDGYETIRQNGIEKFRDDVVAVAPFLADRKNEIKGWNDIKLLSVDIDHLEKWYTHGLLCIGDSAHAMSPIGGVGINLAIQDAVAAANILYKPLKGQTVIGTDVLRAVQRRRAFPARVIQQLQIFIQNKVFRKRMSANGQLNPPVFFAFLNKFPLLQRLPARLLGMGVRVEHVRTPEIQ